MEVGTLSSNLSHFLEGAIRLKDVILVYMFVLSQLADISFEVNSPHGQVEAQIVRVLEHKLFPLADDHLLRDSIQKFGSVLGRGRLAQQFLENGGDGLSAVFVVFVHLEQVIGDLVEGVVVDLGGGLLV